MGASTGPTGGIADVSISPATLATAAAAAAAPGTAAVVELAAIAAAITGCATRNATMLAGVRLARAASGLVTNNSRGRRVLLRCQPDSGLSGAPQDASRSTTGHRCQLGDWTAQRRGRGGHSTEPTT